MSLYDLIQEESVVQNCTASYWSVFVYPVGSHDWLLFCLTLIGPIGSHDLINLPLQVSTQSSSSGGNNFLKIKIILWKMCLIIVLQDLSVPFSKNWQCKGVDHLKIRGARGVPFMKNTPRDRVILTKNAGCLLFMLFGFIATRWLISSESMKPFEANTKGRCWVVGPLLSRAIVLTV